MSPFFSPPAEDEAGNVDYFWTIFLLIYCPLYRKLL
jgi:hypothetical protein